VSAGAKGFPRRRTPSSSTFEIPAPQACIQIEFKFFANSLTLIVRLGIICVVASYPLVGIEWFSRMHLSAAHFLLELAPGLANNHFPPSHPVFSGPSRFGSLPCGSRGILNHSGEWIRYFKWGKVCYFQTKR